MRGLGKTGLCFSWGEWFCFGHEHGFGWRWLPDSIQNGFVRCANPIFCFVFGHSRLAVDLTSKGFKVNCFACCKQLSDTGKTLLEAAQEQEKEKQ